MIKLCVPIVLIGILMQVAQPTTQPTVENRRKELLQTLQSAQNDNKEILKHSGTLDERKKVDALIKQIDATILLVKTATAKDLGDLFSTLDAYNKTLLDEFAKKYGTPEDSLNEMLREEVKNPTAPMLKIHNATLKDFKIHPATYADTRIDINLQLKAKIACDLIIEIKSESQRTTYESTVTVVINAAVVPGLNVKSWMLFTTPAKSQASADWLETPLGTIRYSPELHLDRFRILAKDGKLSIDGPHIPQTIPSSTQSTVTKPFK